MFASASLIRSVSSWLGAWYSATPVESGPRCFIDWSIAVMSRPIRWAPFPFL